MGMKNLMLAMRAMYALGILFFALQGNWNVVLFHGLIFACSLFVPYLGRKDEDFYTLDAIIVLTFMLSLLPTYYTLWQRPESILQAVFGFDKVFHMAGGAGL